MFYKTFWAFESYESTEPKIFLPMLTQLVYVSNRSKFCTAKDIEQILESSVRNNQKKNITGVLLYSDKKFLQCIEGNYEDLKNLYDKIKQDKRHYNPIMIAFVPIRERLFPVWQMAGKSVNLEQVNFTNRMNASEESEFRKILEGETSNSERVSALIKKFFD
jgi:hypothetical protein